MILIFLFVVVIASGTAVALGYFVGVFDPLLTSDSSPESPGMVPTLELTSPIVDGQTPAIILLESTPLSIASTPQAVALSTSTIGVIQSTTPAIPLTPSITTTPPADVCAQLNLDFLNATTNIVTWRLQNTSGTTLTVARIDLGWPIANEAIFNAFMDGRGIWSGLDMAPPTIISDWMGEVDDRSLRTVARLEFVFGPAAVLSGYDLTVGFTNGCEVSSSN